MADHLERRISLMVKLLRNEYLAQYSMEEFLDELGVTADQWRALEKGKADLSLYGFLQLCAMTGNRPQTLITEYLQ